MPDATANATHGSQPPVSPPQPASLPQPEQSQSTERHRSIVDVHLVLRDPDGRILLARRSATGYGDGQLHLPSGHLEAGESIVDAVVREALEEGVSRSPTVPGSHAAFGTRRWVGAGMRPARPGRPGSCRGLVDIGQQTTGWMRVGGWISGREFIAR
jgi:hypothetical protein